MSISNLITNNTKKEWAKIYCKELDAENFQVENLKTDLIEEQTLNNGVVIDSVLKTDLIQEQTLNNGVVIDSVLIADNVIIDSLLRANTIEEKILDNGINIERSKALNLSEEYGDYSLTFTNIDNTAFKTPASFTVANSGLQPYIPFNDPGFNTLTVQEDGYYLIHWESFNNDPLNAGDHIGVRIERVQGDLVLTSNSVIVGTQNGTGDYTISCDYSGRLNDGNELRFTMRVIAGPSVNKSFTSRIFVTRLK